MRYSLILHERLIFSGWNTERGIDENSIYCFNFLRIVCVSDQVINSRPRTSTGTIEH